MHNYGCLCSQIVAYKNAFFSHTSDIKVVVFLLFLYLLAYFSFCFCFGLIWFPGAERTNILGNFYPLDSAEGCHLVETWANSKPGLTVKCTHSTNLESLIVTKGK